MGESSCVASGKLFDLSVPQLPSEITVKIERMNVFSWEREGTACCVCSAGELPSGPLGLGRKRKQALRASPTGGHVCEEGSGTALCQRPAPAFRHWAPPRRTCAPCQQAMLV